MNPSALQFRPRLLELKARQEARRAAEVRAHRPRLAPNGQPVVFVEGDIGSGYFTGIYSPGQDGSLLRIGAVVAMRTATNLRVQRLFIFPDIDTQLYTRAFVDYLGLEAGLFGLSLVEVEDREALATLWHQETPSQRGSETGDVEIWRPRH